MNIKPNSYTNFQDTLSLNLPPNNWPEALKALWYDAKDDWHASHNIAQDMHTPTGSWIHAYLHRKEGDDWNSGYWYRQANRPFPKLTLEEEFQEMLQYVLSEN